MSDFTVKIDRRITGVRVESYEPQGRKRTRNSNFTPGSIGNSEAEQQWQERSEAAYQVGFEDGKKIGFQECRDELKETMSSIKAMISELDRMRDDQYFEADRTIAALAITVASTIIRREISIDHGIVKLIAKDALKAVEDKRRIAIRLNPADVKVISDISPESLSIKQFDVKEDSSIEQGGCIIEGDSGIVDARINVQLEEIAERLLGSNQNEH
ncbi:hypothetical protein J7K93_05920 [bacterium]|nr:hypothetical protein [bacterium]